MKKPICIVCAMLLVLTIALYAVSAAPKYKKLLLLGDSITTGYGLSDLDDSYAELLREHLSLSTKNCKNAAVDGATSTDLNALLPSLRSDIQNADVIVISVGGNDLLNLVWEAADAVIPEGGHTTEKLITIASDPVLKAQMMQKIDPMKVIATLSGYTTNLNSIVSYLRENNSDAEILFLAQYDPFSGVEGYEDITSMTSSAITTMNSNMKTAVEAGGCTYIDVYTHFVNHAMAWTNIAEYDIHPNADGHAEIFELIKAYLGDVTVPDTVAPETNPPETNPPETNPPETNPPETNPPETNPSETNPPETNPPETTPPETNPPETNPPETNPADTNPPQTNPPAEETPLAPPTSPQSGCGSALALGPLFLVLTSGVMLIASKKRR